MKQYKYLLTILSILISVVVFAQKIEKIKSTEFRTEDLRLKKAGVSFRFWIDGQIIEIERSPELIYTGRIINIAEEQPVNSQEEKSAHIYNTYFQINELPEEKVICAFEIIDVYKISDLPDQDAIPGWSHNFFDGYSYMTEQNLNGEYQEKNYHCPGWQTNIPAAANLMNFYAELKANLRLGRSFNTFFNKLKVGCYKTERGGYYLQCRKSKMFIFFYRLFRKRNKK